MGLHYPGLQADPVKRPGYYYSKRNHKLARLTHGDKLPRHMGPWEYIARDDEGTASEVLQRLLQLHPELDPYRLSFATSTPIDLRHLLRSRRRRLVGYVVVGAAALGLGLLFARPGRLPR